MNCDDSDTAGSATAARSRETHIPDGAGPLRGPGDSGDGGIDPRIVAAQLWIEAHLADDIGVATLATAAGFSQSHFMWLSLQRIDEGEWKYAKRLHVLRLSETPA